MPFCLHFLFFTMFSLIFLLFKKIAASNWPPDWAYVSLYLFVIKVPCALFPFMTFYLWVSLVSCLLKALLTPQWGTSVQLYPMFGRHFGSSCRWISVLSYLLAIFVGCVSESHGYAMFAYHFLFLLTTWTQGNLTLTEKLKPAVLENIWNSYLVRSPPCLI